ncbi:MAG: 2-hydroxyacyl-CoA dehydratase [Deltaproteobacteria bacterium]|nr:2-hydroxyacyl-CoA dehydratase [Candidatus Zymogenaceae bacterium]
MANEKIKDPEKEKKKFQSARAMRELMTGYYTESKIAEASGSKKIAWITSGGPVEPLHAMDIIPIYPENHGAMLGASRMSVEMCGISEDMGYSRDLCSYFRGDIGSAVTKKSPIPGGLPKPDFLIACNNICGTVTKWYEILARFFDVPMYLIDTPFIHQHKTEAGHRYVRSQMEEYIRFLEDQCGKKMDRDRLKEVGQLSLEGVSLWNEVLSTCEHRPAPMSCFDAFFFIAPIVTLRGTAQCNDFYVGLLAELKRRITDGIGAVDDEKYRLLWDNIPVWFALRPLSELFASNSACLVADTYTNAWAKACLDPENLIETMSRSYTEIYLNIDIEMMVSEIKQLIKRYSADGFVMHSNRSCKPYSLGQLDIAKIIQKDLDIPTIMVEADMTDERSFSEAQTRTRIEAFIESLKAQH